MFMTLSFCHACHFWFRAYWQFADFAGSKLITNYPDDQLASHKLRQSSKNDFKVLSGICPRRKPKFF
jgi:hypothetical protein